jgi:hypothetical protein
MLQQRYGVLNTGTHTNTVPNFENFVQRLKDHLLTHLLGKEYDGDEQDYTHTERNNVQFQDNQFYSHRMLQVNYTSYDMRRQRDVINPVSRPV